MNMIEKAARALAAKKIGLRGDTTGANLPDDLWRQCIPEVRIVIEALREPTPEVVKAGVAAMSAFASVYHNARTVYTDMIDAALKGELLSALLTETKPERTT